MPTLILWGGRDPMIPAAHGRDAHAAMPGSRLEVFAGAGHFPHRDDPARFVETLLDFIERTRPASMQTESVRRLLLAGP